MFPLDDFVPLFTRRLHQKLTIKFLALQLVYLFKLCLLIVVVCSVITAADVRLGQRAAEEPERGANIPRTEPVEMRLCVHAGISSKCESLAEWDLIREIKNV